MSARCSGAEILALRWRLLNEGREGSVCRRLRIGLYDVPLFAPRWHAHLTTPGVGARHKTPPPPPPPPPPPEYHAAVPRPQRIWPYTLRIDGKAEQLGQTALRDCACARTRDSSIHSTAAFSRWAHQCKRHRPRPASATKRSGQRTPPATEKPGGFGGLDWSAERDRTGALAEVQITIRHCGPCEKEGPAEWA
jgi:hypothetical protein